MSDRSKADNNNIDFVITWVDGADPVWLEERARYKGEIGNADVSPTRYREWDNLQYVFRGIEKFAPWVHKVYLVTCGHYPKWLNLDNPRFRLVKHSDIMPEKWLPTFSSRAIEFNFHRIEGLSEQFVNFNDDMFITKPVKPEDFFKNGKPCETAVMTVWPQMSYELKGAKFLAPLHDTFLINRNFKKLNSVGRNFFKWFNLKYGWYNLYNIYMLPHLIFTGFMNFHIPSSYLKSTFYEIWEAERDIMEDTCSHRFRQPNDLNPWVFVYWQLAKGEFCPRSPWTGKKYYIEKGTIDEITRVIPEQKYKMMCLNDRVRDENDFEPFKERIKAAFDKILPEKSSFEL